MTDIKPPFFYLGEEDFANTINQKAVYVDKTGFLNNLVTKSPKVTLLTRPRRFGKSLTLSMLQNFLEMNYENPEDRSRPEELFRKLTVFKEDKPFCDEYMGRYPVVSVSFKGVEGSCFKKAAGKLFDILVEQAEKFKFLLNREDISPYSNSFIKVILDLQNCKESLFDQNDSLTVDAESYISQFLKKLISLLHDVYHQQVFLCFFTSRNHEQV